MKKVLALTLVAFAFILSASGVYTLFPLSRNSGPGSLGSGNLVIFGYHDILQAWSADDKSFHAFRIDRGENFLSADHFSAPYGMTRNATVDQTDGFFPLRNHLSETDYIIEAYYNPGSADPWRESTFRVWNSSVLKKGGKPGSKSPTYAGSDTDWSIEITCINDGSTFWQVFKEIPPKQPPESS